MKNSKLIIFISLIIIIISTLGIISATDVSNSTDVSDNVGTNSNSDTINHNTTSHVNDEYTNSLNNFKDEFNKSQINLTYDYKYNSKIDKDFKPINLTNQKGIVINGNNHTIDLANSSILFNLTNSSITINDMVIKNSHNSSILSVSSNIVTRNVTYINDIENEYARALTLSKSNLYSYDDKYIDNYNKYGSSIFASGGSNLHIVNSTIKNKHNLIWGIFYIRSSTVEITNTTFNNLTSEYSPAFHIQDSEGNITNSRFINLKANKTAGAIGIKGLSESININNCTFINTTSQKNGGALYVDVTANDEDNEGEIILSDSYFDNCSSQMGGAIVQLGGELKIDNTVFKNNNADYSGGAVYTSFTDLSISNTTFDNNNVLNDMEDYSDGGALYVDENELKINNSKFINNHAHNGQSAYIYSANYEIYNSYFDGNIHTFFESSKKMSNNTFTGKANILNDTFYPTYYEGNGTTIQYNPIIFDEKLANSSYFNLVDYGLVSPVRNQGTMGSCWAFATAGSLESAFLKASNKTAVLDISENNMQNILLKYSKWGVDDSIEGVYLTDACTYLTSWIGITNSEDDSYDELGKLSPIYDNQTKYHIHDIVYIKPRNNITDNYRIKEAILKYGAIAALLKGASGSSELSYNPKTYAAYYNGTFGKEETHGINVVGWNDTYSKENFLIQPPADGAWIIKNSWGSNWGDHGYYYVSYYDTSFASGSTLLAFTLNNDFKYERNYQYDFTGDVNFKLNQSEEDNISYYNIYTVAENELITAVGTYFNDSNVNYTITITREDNDTYTQSGMSTHYGFETIKLNKTFAVKANQTVTVKITTNNLPIMSDTRLKHVENRTFSQENDETEDLSETDEIACIKMYTITDHSKIEAENTTIQYNSTKYLQAKFLDENGEKLTDTQVEFRINNKTYNKTTDENGIATLDENLEPGNYTVTIVNPVGQNKINVTLIIKQDEDNKNSTPKTAYYQNYYKTTNKQINNRYNLHTKAYQYKIYVENNLITQTNAITIQTLNTIFNQTFTNGHLLVYIDGILVYNSTTTDDIYTIILEITEKLLGNHEIKVVYTDNNNNTRTFTENITIN